ncbi:hypothetical protein ACFLTS_00200, partial [Chloroflexota bacterium]
MKIKPVLPVLFSALCALILLPLLSCCGPATDITTPTPLATATPAPTSTPTIAPTPTITPTPISGPFYRNTTYGFSISYPEEWVEEETGEVSPVVFIYDPSG